MTYNGQMLSRMLVLATNYHNGQYDKGNKPYILHCLTVMHKLRTNDEELQCIALGHDLLEDTPCTEELLAREGMSQRVINGIRVLTKTIDKSEDQYLAAIKLHYDACLVKMADLQHNSDIRRLKGVSANDIKRMIKYHQMYLELEEVIKEYRHG